MAVADWSQARCKRTRGPFAYSRLSPWDLEQRVASIVDSTLKDISQRYKIQEELGAGAQATVYKATHKRNHMKARPLRTPPAAAARVIEIKELEDDELFDALRMEILLLRQLDHPHIVGIREVVHDANSVYIECLSGGELFDALLAKGPFKEVDAQVYFAQVALAVEYMHERNVVHRDLKAENLVFSAKGSPQIKCIDFGGACTCTPDQMLTGLVGTPQYVAPEVVTGFGEVNPTDEPYGKGCDLWSMGVLLYVMLSKTMPFRAKQVDALLRQVVKGRFAFQPDERWRHVSADAKDLISQLLTVDVSKRIDIAGVRQHPWAAAAIAQYEELLPKYKTKAAIRVDADGEGGGAMGAVMQMFARRKGASSSQLAKRKPPGMSKEQQYWYAMEISPPTDMQQLGGVKVSADGTFEMENVPPEMAAILADIAKKKAASSGRSGAADAAAPPLPAVAEASVTAETASSSETPRTESREAEMTRLATEAGAYYRQGGEQNEALETLALLREKDDLIAKLQEKIDSQEAALDEQAAEIEELKAAAMGAPSPAELDAALERAQQAEGEREAQHGAAVKMQAKLSAVTTLYTEAMQREAALKVEFDSLRPGAAA
ncbi:hypothetical protein EMIHUDRAFT_461387 [Emiliania huxleyi CCMP1516]|uniref:Protein kinase domain-containing protein n=2 Tax=Emiliania huxleyi TaxID=2903 RepID=A0A0D3J430_EMIH1|nr:hypothetical protein EMIHUDRAFT_461387 [Emiliania huxleyi CCMP1516]EOD18265.1 hypothetical protein EMIHUDRAFT_461387 [Emiliania huxleyi CCMP1516]|eukprot:XP_005770694.1 hypothetical protein EMIHUDRAFT_461387 [Emiliania huxleyi CCMP1516]